MFDAILELQQPILLIEDYAFARGEAIKALENKSLDKDVIAPATAEECIVILESKEFSAAAVDDRLTHWVGKNFEDPLVGDGFEIKDGVGIAELLMKNNVKDDFSLGMFSSHEPNLVARLRQRELTPKVQLLSQRNLSPRESNKYLIDFVENHLTKKIIIKPLFTETNLPVEAELYFAKKILTCRAKGNYTWRIGNYAWKAAVNLPMRSENEDDIYAGVEKIMFTLQYQNRYLYRLTHENSGEQLDAENILSDDEGRQSKSAKAFGLMFDLFFVLITTRTYLNGEIQLTLLKTLNRTVRPEAKLQLVKILFKVLSGDPGFGFTAKEQVYDFLSLFKEDGFPMVLDVFKGRIDYAEEGQYILKLDSYSPENIVLRPAWDQEFLHGQYLELSSRFEYTVFIPDTGGHGYHFEVL